MVNPASGSADNRIAIALVLAAMLCISINDVTIKALSDAYPLHQMVFVRSALAIPFTLVFLTLERGWGTLWPARPGLQVVRALLIVIANLVYFAALTVLPIATATALFFVAPLFITALSVPILGEQIGPRRLAALVVGFAGVLVIVAPGAEGGGASGAPHWAYALPLVAALCYAGMQVLTRKLAAGAGASAMALYIQVTFCGVAAAFWISVGDGRLAEGQDNPALIFLLRPWVWPAPDHIWMFGLLGIMGGIIGYSLSQAYRIGEAATVSSYEYVALPLAIFWGWAIWSELPSPRAWAGIAMILGAGLYVFLRERQRAVPAPPTRPPRRG